MALIGIKSHKIKGKSSVMTQCRGVHPRLWPHEYMKTETHPLIKMGGGGATARPVKVNRLSKFLDQKPYMINSFGIVQAQLSHF